MLKGRADTKDHVLLARVWHLAVEKARVGVDCVGRIGGKECRRTKWDSPLTGKTRQVSRQLAGT
jgi:hypothetical protein